MFRFVDTWFCKSVTLNRGRTILLEHTLSKSTTPAQLRTRESDLYISYFISVLQLESQLWEKNTRKLKAYSKAASGEIAQRLNEAAKAMGFDLSLS